MVEVNGGGPRHQRLRDRIHMELGGIPTVRASDPVQSVAPKIGATLLLDFDRRCRT